MRTLTQLFIALSIFACFAAAAPSCSRLNNNKDLCFAASSLCTWTDDPASDTCVDACPLSPKVATDCTSTNGCAFTAGNCAFSTKCATAELADCNNANNCIYISDQCRVNPAASLNCNNGNGDCLATLPVYCTKTNIVSCAPDGSPAGTCTEGVATPDDCTAPCSTAIPVDTCISKCINQTQETCGQRDFIGYCIWANNSCTQNVDYLDCSIVGPRNCYYKPQCIIKIIYNCSTTYDSLKKFCRTDIAETACSNAQNAWCITTNTDTCTVKENYCVQGQPGNACDTDSVNCTTAPFCETLDNNACTWSANQPTCNQNVCTGAFSSCATAAAGGCKVNGSDCAPADASCYFNVGGTCAANSSDTNGFFVSFCASILTFFFAF